MKKNKKRLSIIAFLVMIAAITIGYSALSSTLNITGTSRITAAGWDVHFANVNVASGSVTGTQVVQAPTITQVDGKDIKVEYEVNLNIPGEYYEFTVNVVNGGTINAKLSAAPTLTGVSPAQDVYVNYTFTHGDGSAVTAGETINAGASKTYKVRVEFDSSINASQLPTSQQTLNLGVAMTWEQA